MSCFERIRQNQQYRTVYRRGKVRFGRYVAVHYYPVPSIPTAIGLSVSKKVGNAVERNKVKRRLRHIAGLHFGRLRPGYWIVFSARPASRDADFSLLEKDILSALRGARLVILGE